MAVITIRGLDDDVRDRLRIRAAQHGRSMEAEVRAILTAAVESPAEGSMIAALVQMRDTLVGLELATPPRANDARDPFA